MTGMVPERLTVGIGSDARNVAVLRGAGGAPGLFWMCGYRSAMAGSKATAMAEYAAQHGLASTRFDYSGTAESGGDFLAGTISRWLEDAQAVFATTTGPQIVVASSMGGWLALRLAVAELASGHSRVAGLVLIAPAIDMTKVLMWDAFTAAQKKAIKESGVHYEPSAYSEDPTPVTLKLIEDGEKHLFGDRLIATGCPVHILQGMEDRDVPWRQANALVERFASDDVVLTLIKDGDHRLSRPEDIARLTAAIDGIRNEMGGKP